MHKQDVVFHCMSDAYPITDLTTFQINALAVISALDEPHGLAIKDRLEAYYEKEVHHGRIYPNLSDLVEKGLVNKGTKDRRTNEYTISRRGERELESMRNFLNESLEEEAVLEP